MTNQKQAYPLKTKYKQNAVVITHAPQGNYRQDFAALPKNYGTSAYYQRSDIQTITQLVEDNLTQLDAHTGFIRRLQGKMVLLKPNLVTVYSQMGLVERDYPETTDPRCAGCAGDLSETPYPANHHRRIIRARCAHTRLLQGGWAGPVGKAPPGGIDRPRRRTDRPLHHPRGQHSKRDHHPQGIRTRFARGGLFRSLYPK
jgi:hypothetical protein